MIKICKNDIIILNSRGGFMEDLKKHRLQITKFGFYGLLKNLRFFEPYMIIYFLMSGLDLFLVGILFSIREIIIYIFEIPSGVIADRYGKKTELVICFIFYILSFLMFFVADQFYLFAIAMILFALGEAFRSGTHKSMIMAFMDQENIKSSKTKIYGLTRSYSLIGSMIASLVSIGLVLYLPEIRFLFLVAIIPYILDLLLILSYPNTLNQKRDISFSFKSFIKHNIDNIKYTFKTSSVRNAVFNSASYQATFKSIKDYIQPILISMSMGLLIFNQFDEDEHTKIYIGIIYAIIYLISAISSRNAYRIKSVGRPSALIAYIWLFTAIVIGTLSFFLDSLLIVGFMFMLLYVMMNIRKPIMVERIGDVTDDDKRATVLSVEAQTSSLLIVIFAPLIGLLADYSMSLMFMIFSGIMLIIFIGHMIFVKKT
jgi:MFS family permease